MSRQDAGIDYGLGTTNIDHDTGIRYGVISMQDLSECAHESFEPDYGPPSCPSCGNDVATYDADRHQEKEDLGHGDTCIYCQENAEAHAYTHSRIMGTWGGCYDYTCENCHVIYDSEEVYPEEALSYILDDGEYAASLDEQNDVFIVKSPYYTYAQFCSPCAPGAGHLSHTGDADTGLVKTYCFAATWFDNDIAPYPYYRVSDNSRVNP